MSESQPEEAILVYQQTKQQFIEVWDKLVSQGEGSYTLTVKRKDSQGKEIGEDFVIKPKKHWEQVGTSSKEFSVAGAIYKAVDPSNSQAVADQWSFTESSAKHTKEVIRVKNKLAEQLNETRRIQALERELERASKKRSGMFLLLFFVGSII